MKNQRKRTISRRQSLGLLAGGAGLLAAQPVITSLAQDLSGQAIVVNPTPRFELSPYLYMQFMEPLGATDASVEAAWEHLRDDWREDVVAVTRELAPTMLRWGGIYLDFYRWREGVGPREKRPPMLNLLWGGIESNQVGTAEFVDFSRRIGAEPLICVNFESDGRQRYMKAKGSVRTADARESADWVRYCNDPANTERRAHGQTAPHAVKYWQIGNETSYDKQGFDLETAARKTAEFAKAMRGADPSIQLIAWGDSGWAGRMLEIAGEHVQMLAFHHMFNPDDEKRPVLRGESYRRDADATWQQLMKAWEINDRKIRTIRESLGGRTMPLAMTECHFTVPGRDRGDVNSTWATGVAYARILNNHQRHGDLLKIATAADFCGTRWQNNAVIIPVPKGQGRAYLQPVARVMQLYRHHLGSHAIGVKSAPDGLDITASLTKGTGGDTLFLHVVNTQRTRAVKGRFQVAGRQLQSGRVFEIADDPMVEVTLLNSADVMRVTEKAMASATDWEFPAASVSAVEIKLA
jgi:alpha-N-arabinofuranosidase